MNHRILKNPLDLLNPVKISIRVTDLGSNDTVKNLPEKVFALLVDKSESQDPKKSTGSIESCEDFYQGN